MFGEQENIFLNIIQYDKLGTIKLTRFDNMYRVLVRYNYNCFKELRVKTNPYETGL